jgi:hypothetical protein
MKKKVDPEAQMKWIDAMLQSNEDESANATAQFFARDEEDRQNRAKDEEELQMKPKASEELQQKPASGNTGTQTEMPDNLKGEMKEGKETSNGVERKKGDKKNDANSEEKLTMKEKDDEDFEPKPWHFCNDYTEMPLVLESNGYYEYSDWEEDLKGTLLISASIGALLSTISSGFSLKNSWQRIIGMLSGLATAKGFVMEKRLKNYISQQSLWFGKFYYNIFTGEIVYVEEKKTKKTKSRMPEFSYLQERIKYTLSGDIVATKTTPVLGIYAPDKEKKNIKNPVPSKGMNIYD